MLAGGVNAELDSWTVFAAFCWCQSDYLPDKPAPGMSGIGPLLSGCLTSPDIKGKTPVYHRLQVLFATRSGRRPMRPKAVCESSRRELSNGM